jgi:membrane-associated PAP2 superfamily phosphatase
MHPQPVCIPEFSDLANQNDATLGPKAQTGILLLFGMGIALVVITWAAVHWNIDRRVSALFYHPDRGWFLKQTQPWWLLYKYGTIPGLLLTLGAIVGVYFSILRRGCLAHRRQFLLIFLTTIIAGGILVNAVLKPYWGRPRPRNTTEFGGQRSFLHPYQRGLPGEGESFPCGHCTMGFIFVTLAVFHRPKKSIAVAGTAFGVLYGSFVGLGRIVQGAHFVTDVVWSLGVIGMTAVALNYLVLPFGNRLLAGTERMRSGQKRIWAGSMVCLALVITALFLTRRPFFEDYTFALKLDRSTQELVIQSEFPLAHQKIIPWPREEVRLTIEAQGFGWIGAKHRVEMRHESKKDTMRITVGTRTDGYFSEINHRILIHLPQELAEKVTLRFAE